MSNLPTNIKRTITVSSSFVALHRWKKAPAVVSFLRAFHRHIFKVQVTLEVKHNERDLEFFMVQDALQMICSEFEFGKHDKSCETFAEEIWKSMLAKGYTTVQAVSVSEDGENGATLCLQ